MTIPKPLRRRLGIRARQVLDIREEGGRLVVAKAETRDPVEAVYGLLKLEHPTDRLMAELRGEARRR